MISLWVSGSDIMILLIYLIKIVIVVWILLFFVMLPVYFIRKHKNPDDEKNTIKGLIIRALMVSALMVLVMGSGLAAMYFDDFFNGIQ